MSVIGRLKRGCVERPSPAKQAACRLTIQIARAVYYGRDEEAARLREEICPDLVRRRELEARRKAEQGEQP